MNLNLLLLLMVDLETKKPRPHPTPTPPFLACLWHMYSVLSKKIPGRRCWLGKDLGFLCSHAGVCLTSALIPHLENPCLSESELGSSCLELNFGSECHLLWLLGHP